MSREQSIASLAWFEFRRALSRSGARMGLILFAGILAVGHYDYWFNGESAQLFFEASAVGVMGLVSFGLADDRRRHFDRYLIRNHIDGPTYLAAKAIAMFGVLLTAAAIAILIKAAYTGGNFNDALWYATVATAAALFVVPLAMIVEGYVDTSMPAAVVVLGMPVVVGLLYLTTRSVAPFEWIGFTAIELRSWRSLVPLVTRAAIGIVPLFLIAGALIQLRLRRY